jgi:hypothetical protein
MSDYHRETKPLRLRVTSLFVIIAFCVTQFDIRMAYANSQPISAPQPVQTADREPNAADDVRFMKNPGTPQDWDFPLSPATTEKKSAKEAEKEKQAAPKTIYAKLENPLANPRGEAVQSTATENGVTVERYQYADGTSYSLDQKNGRLREIVDFTKWNADQSKYDLERRLFSYEEGPEGAMRLSVRSVNPNGIDDYQIFAANADGNPTDLLEVGVRVGEQKVKTSAYDPSKGLRIDYDLANGNSKTVYELEPGKDGVYRPLLYTDLVGEQEVSLEMIYQDDTSVKTVTVADRTTGAFEVYEQESGRLLKMGHMKVADGQTIFAVQYEVQVTERTQLGKKVPVYSFDDGSGRVLQRLMTENGAVGDWVRIKDESVDLEYVYDTDQESGKQILTILNYGAGTYLKFERQKKMRQTLPAVLRRRDCLSRGKSRRPFRIL